MSDTALEYLVGSTTRPATLTALRDHGRLSIRALEDRASVSRRTLKRTLGTMESRGWVQSVDGTYELTSLGVAILSAYERCRENERIAERFRPFLERTPASAFDLGIGELNGSNLVDPTGDPTAPTDRLLELRTDASRIRECAPFLLRDSVSQFVERATAERSPPSVTLVLADGRPTPEQYTEAYCEQFETLLDAPSVDVYANSDGVRIPFGLADGHAFVGSMEPDGMPHTLIDGEQSALVDWADRRFEAALAAATPLE
ncbi:helix-turn-helix transcriptional regulator [Haloplanus halobius]|uniref:helix-turn-helix transcriptional regulator n=1 Tax=Haloplanus halobius TaxID=2934938 RepID=UPI00200E27FD|nr:hypothetical protein [Haloplanus sp. XH21]